MLKLPNYLAQLNEIVRSVQGAEFETFQEYSVVRVGSITLLETGAEAQRGEAWNTAMCSDTAFVALGENPVFSYPLPDDINTVLKIELK